MPQSGTPAPQTPNTQTPEVRTTSPWNVTFFAGIGVVVIALGFAVAYWTGALGSAATPEEPKRIGIVGIPQVKEADEGFKTKMIALGYGDAEFTEYSVVPGPTLDADVEKAVRELIEKDIDLIFADFEIPAKIAAKVTNELGRSDIPVIFISRLHDPVKFGLVESFESSGSNLTGVATSIFDLVQRHMEFLKQISPDAKKLGIFAKGFQIPALADEYYSVVKEQAPRFGLEIVEYTTAAPPPQAKAEFERITATIQKGDIDAMMHIGGHYYVTQEIGESNLAKRLGIPMATNYEDIPRGGHFTYANGTFESGEQAAVMADKIFNGARPSDIPVEYALKSKLSVHLGRAKEAGITFPDSMLFIAENKYEDDSQFPPFEDH